MLKDIKGFEGLYRITENGEIFGVVSGKWRKPYKTTTSDYLTIDLWKDGKRYKRLLHRLVAEAYVPNPENKPEVDHKDDDIYNFKADNLQWLTHKENLHKSYNTMSPVRNYRKCKLVKDEQVVGEFDSILQCSRFASLNYGLSYSMLNKHLNHKGYYIVKV
jgi:hypothetical protein